MKDKIIRDPIHGYIKLDEKDIEFIDTPMFQRLKRIRQSGCHTVYPSANQTRFEHSIGVMHLGVRVFHVIYTKISEDLKNEISEYYKTLEITVKYACLLHDVGHAPLSHTGEVLFNMKDLKRDLIELIGVELDKGAEHELSSCIVALRIFGNKLSELCYDRELFCRMITGSQYHGENQVEKFKNGLIDILNSSIDVDKLDYFSRDSFSSGTNSTLVSIDTERLINSYNIKNGILCFDSSALSVVSNFVYARNALYMWVYNHHTTIYTDNIIIKYLSNLIDKNGNIQQQYFSTSAIIDRQIDDYDIYHLIKEKRNIDSLSILEEIISNRYGKINSSSKKYSLGLTPSLSVSS